MDQGDELSFDDEDERAGRFCDGSSYFIALALIWRGREMEAAVLFQARARQSSPHMCVSL
jgi:hypothetical protein